MNVFWEHLRKSDSSRYSEPKCVHKTASTLQASLLYLFAASLRSVYLNARWRRQGPVCQTRRTKKQQSRITLFHTSGTCKNSLCDTWLLCCYETIWDADEIFSDVPKRANFSIKNRTAVFMVCTEGQAEYSTKVFMISTLCNDASHPIPHPKCQSGALVCVSCWEQQVAVNRYTDTPVRETDRQNRWLLLSPHDCERAQSRRQDPPLFPGERGGGMSC